MLQPQRLALTEAAAINTLCSVGPAGLCCDCWRSGAATAGVTARGCPLLLLRPGAKGLDGASAACRCDNPALLVVGFIFICMSACSSSAKEGVSQMEVPQLKHAGQQTENLAKQSPLQH
jgi:hypothetical protein